MKCSSFLLTLCLSVFVPAAAPEAEETDAGVHPGDLAANAAAEEFAQDFTPSAALSKVAYRGVAPDSYDFDGSDLSAQEQAALKTGFLDNDRLKKLQLEEELQSREAGSYGASTLELRGHSLFRFQAKAPDSDLEELYEGYGQSAPSQAQMASVPAFFWTQSNFYNDYLGYMLRFEDLPRDLLAIPAVFTAGEEFNFKIFTDVIKDGPLSGISRIQSALQNLEPTKGSTDDQEEPETVKTSSLLDFLSPQKDERSRELGTSEQEYSLVQYSLPSEQVLRLGAYRGFKSLVPRNHGTIDYGALQTAVMARLLGLSSQTGKAGLLSPVSAFDKLLYSPSLGRNIRAGDSLQSLVQRCDFGQGPCGLYAQGPYAVTLQEQDLTALSELNLERGLDFARNKASSPSWQKDNARLTARASANKTGLQDVASDPSAGTEGAGQSAGETDPLAMRVAAGASSATYGLENEAWQDPVDDDEEDWSAALHQRHQDAQRGLPGRHEQVKARLNNPSDVPLIEDDDAIALNLNDKNPGGINRSYEAFSAEESDDEGSAFPDDWSWVQYSKVSETPAAVEKGLQILLEPYGKVYVNLDHTLLSDTGYVNYPTLVPQELSLLCDLGYRLDIREFYGNALTRGGSRQERLTYVNSQGYGRYEEGGINLKRPSQVPLGTGFLAMTSHSDLRQDGNILSEGPGSVGIRVDGSFNTLTVPEETSVRMTGPGSAGIAFSYGRFNALSLDGSVSALGEDSVGLLCDFGSNLYSNLKEYRGSYQRNSTVLGRDLPLLPDLDGPLLSKINISGTLQGQKAAILISPSAMVEEINVTGQAVIQGDIISLFTPILAEEGNGFVIRTDVTRTMRDPAIQLPPALVAEDRHRGVEFIGEHLGTRLRLGPVRKDVQSARASKIAGDPKANILIDGNILGPNLSVDAMGGKIEITGQVRARTLRVENAVLRLSGENTHHLSRLLLGKNGVLDLVNGQSDLVRVSLGMAAGENACVKVDTDLSGRILDKIEIKGDLRSRYHQIKVEPGLKYDDLRRLQSSPLLMLSFVSDFVRNMNEILVPHGMTASFPEHVWDSGGGFGREIRCTGRGCRIGAFVRNGEVYSGEELHPWRYVLSALGLLLIIAGTYLYFSFQRNQHRIRE